jgi:hypothetical protein
MSPFNEGMEDRRKGRVLTDCPYTGSSAQAEEWRRGWLIASTSSRLRPQGDQTEANKAFG